MSEYRANHEDVRLVECPDCGASPGRGCTPLIFFAFHTARAEAASIGSATTVWKTHEPMPGFSVDSSVWMPYEAYRATQATPPSIEQEAEHEYP